MTDVVLLTVDSLRADYFTPEYFPSCWGIFEEEFAIFENAYANGVATPFSFPTVITGNYSEPDGSLQDSHPTIAELYGGRTWALTNNPHLRADRGYDRGFDSFADDINEIGSSGESLGLVRKMKSLGASVPVVKRAYNWLQGTTGVHFIPQSGHAADVSSQLLHAMNDGRGFFWAHYMDAHYPFKPDKIPDKDIDVGRSSDSILEANDRFKQGEASSTDIEILRSLYGEMVQYLDRAIATLFDDLRDRNRWEDSVIILMSDHGEAFGEDGVYNHMWDADPIDPLVRVPLLVKFPDEPGRTYSHLVQNADLPITLSNIFDWGINPPLTKPLLDDSGRVIVSKSNSAVRVTTPEGRAIRRRDGSNLGTESIDGGAISVLNDAEIPTIEKTGEMKEKQDHKEDEIMDRLEYLGYK